MAVSFFGSWSLSSVEAGTIAAGQLNSGEENFGELVVACGGGPKVLEFIEEAHDEVAFAVEREVAIALDLSIGCMPR